MIARVSWPRRRDAALAIVAALAIASAVAAGRGREAFRRWKEANPQRFGTPYPTPWPAPIQAFNALTSRVLGDMEAGLFSASLALATAAYRPRRGVRPKRRGPGRAALAIAGTLAAIQVAAIAWWDWIGPGVFGIAPLGLPGMPSTFWSDMPRNQGASIGWATAAGWLYLAATGQWRRVSDPFDRAGRWVGWTWIVASVFSWLLGQLP